MKLRIENLGKRYGRERWALEGFSLEIERGAIGLLGPNGAGKSTLMRLLATISRPTEGKVLWQGVDAHRDPGPLRRVLGYLPQDFGVYPHLNALEFLAYIGAVKGLAASYVRRRIEELLELTHLSEVRKLPLGEYSGGMKQRLGIAQALLNDPELLIVDEPTVGLDPEERVSFRNFLAELSGDRIVLLSTHIVSDVEAVATELVLIHQGHLVLHTSPEDLLASVEGRVWEWTVPSAELPAVKEKFQVGRTRRESTGVRVRALAEEVPSPAARAVAPSLEDAYLHHLARLRGEKR